MSNVEALQEFLQGIETLGRGGDTILAHITKQEAAKLEAAGGSGTFHPITGLPEFFGGDGDGVGGGADDGGDDSGPGDAGEGVGGADGVGGGAGDQGDDTGPGDQGIGVGGATGNVGAPDNVDDFTEITDDFNIDQLAQAFTDVEDTSFVGGLFGFGKTLGFDDENQVEAQTTLGFSPASFAIGLAFGLPGTIAVAAAKGLLGFEDPFAVEANLSTGDIGLANSGTPGSVGSLANDDSENDQGDGADTRQQQNPRAISVADTSSGDLSLSTDFTAKIAELLGQDVQGGFFKQPDFQLLDDFNVNLVSAFDRTA